MRLGPWVSVPTVIPTATFWIEMCLFVWNATPLIIIITIAIRWIEIRSRLAVAVDDVRELTEVGFDFDLVQVGPVVSAISTRPDMGPARLR